MARTPRLTRSPARELRLGVKLRVIYADTDQMGVVYYANYFVWFEVARTDLIRSLGWSYREMEAAGFILPVIEATCQYRRPSRYEPSVRKVAIST